MISVVVPLVPAQNLGSGNAGKLLPSDGNSKASSIGLFSGAGPSGCTLPAALYLSPCLGYHPAYPVHAGIPLASNPRELFQMHDIFWRMGSFCASDDGMPLSPLSRLYSL